MKRISQEREKHWSLEEKKKSIFLMFGLSFDILVYLVRARVESVGYIFFG